jgi:hypothetical protein
LTGFRYDAHNGVMTFAPADTATRWFWSSGSAWGTVEQSANSVGNKEVWLNVLAGSVFVDRVVLGGATFQPERAGQLSRGSYQLQVGTLTSNSS